MLQVSSDEVFVAVLGFFYLSYQVLKIQECRHHEHRVISDKRFLGHIFNLVKHHLQLLNTQLFCWLIRRLDLLKLDGGSD